MPVTKKVNKTPCSLCHRVVEELKYHYDICEPCHDVKEQDSQPETSDIESDDGYSTEGLSQHPDEPEEFDSEEEDSDDDIPLKDVMVVAEKQRVDVLPTKSPVLQLQKHCQK